MLINSTLLNLPVYMFSCRLAPVTVVDEMEKIIRLFLWGTSEGKRKLHLVSFEGVCLPRELGGLGIKRVREINLSLLCKWFWRLNEDCLWVRLLKQKYGVVGVGYYPKRLKGTIGISTWRGLVKVEPLFKALTRMKVGNGQSTSFWCDVWCEEFPLFKIFPALYESSHKKCATVAEFFVSFDVADPVRWFLADNHVQNQQLLMQVQALCFFLRSFTLTDVEDQLIWQDGTDILSVSECSRQIFTCRRRFFSHDEFIFDWDKVWVQDVPSKITFLVWLVIRNRVLTHADLQRRGFNWVSKCFLCGMETEDIDHLFVSCCFIKQI